MRILRAAQPEYGDRSLDMKHWSMMSLRLDTLSIWFGTNLFIHPMLVVSFLCVSSEEHRRNNIVGAVYEVRVNYLDLTPSLAQTLGP
jgi:hypothetical protein